MLIYPLVLFAQCFKLENYAESSESTKCLARTPVSQNARMPRYRSTSVPCLKKTSRHQHFSQTPPGTYSDISSAIQSIWFVIDVEKLPLDLL